jgi:hypothetical protein
MSELAVNPVSRTDRNAIYEQELNNEFDYRPVPLMAVTGFVLALLSVLSVVVWPVIPVAIVAAVVSGFAWWTIIRSEGAYSGQWLALAGFILPICCAIGGVMYQSYLYANEVPEGYRRVSFSQEISAKGFITDRGTQLPHPDVLALDGQKVFLKGYIYPTNNPYGLTKFLLLKDNGQCCFGGKPALQDRLTVSLQGFTFDHTYHKVSVAGTFRLNPNFSGGELDSLYELEAESCALSASDF